MAFIPRKTADIGDVAKLLVPVTVYNGTFEAGTVVKIIDKTDDGFRIDDGYGHTASGIDVEKLAVIKDAEPESKPEKDVSDWIYETGKEIPEILGSGSEYRNVQHTKDETKAFRLYRENSNNYLIRYKLNKNLRNEQEYWDEFNKEWVKN